MDTTQSKPGIFLPSRYHSLPVRTIYPAEHAGIPGKVLCVRNRQAVDSEKQNGKRQLLPFDLGSHRKRNPAARRKRECAVNLGAGLPLAGFGRGKESVPGISAPFFPAGKLQV